MDALKLMTSPIGSFVRAAVRLARDRRGVAAVEFAFVAPLLMVMYFVTSELAAGIETNKKVSRIGSQVADLITQQDKISKSELEAIMKIGQSTIQPYARSVPEITVTAIKITAQPNSKVEVAWSRRLKDGAYSVPFTKGSIATVPPALNIPNSFLIRVEADLGYEPMIVWSIDQKEALGLLSAFDDIQMGENYFLRPRASTEIPCADC